jgi:DNA-binding transcriptional MerR regulator
MNGQRTYRVKEVARIAGVSVRALHHYDEIGLLVPSARTPAGYRLYDDDDLLRLQQILIGRELGLSLEEIRRSLDDPRFDRRRALLSQRAELERRARQTAEMIRAVDRTLAVIDGGSGGNMDMKGIFDGFDPSRCEDEARERWGDTSAFQASKARAARYGDEDWKQIRAESAAIYGAFAAARSAGKDPAGEDVLAIVERHRLSIDRWFYPCSAAMHARLADLYESDPRFAANIDVHGEGLTAFLVAAIRAAAARAAHG